MRIVLPLLAAALLPLAARAAEPPALFPFAIPWDDAVPGVATDVSFLNTKPAGANGFIVVKNGHFAESKTGRRVRFLGVSFAFKADYPDHADADKVAARFAKAGINLVRIHHHDATAPSGMLWDRSGSGPWKFSTDAIDRLDYLIAQLKKHGIYVDLNLYVSRRFRPEDGFPPEVDDVKETYDQRLNLFDRRMLDLQKQFARDYLTRKNPYTGLRYTDDPCVAMIEITNENSLYGWPGEHPTDFYDTLPAPFRAEIVALWNVWLGRKYGGDPALRAAWALPTASGQADLLTATSRWSLQDQTGQARLETTAQGSSATAASVRIETPKASEAAWHTQAMMVGLDLKNEAAYTLSFRARADKSRAVDLYSSLDESDWHHTGLDAQLRLTPEAKEYRFTFVSTGARPNHSRIVFAQGNATGTVWIDDLKLAPARPEYALPAGQSLAARTVDIPATPQGRQLEDWRRFIAETERGFADEMRGYLRRDLNVHAPLVNTQMAYGGMTGFLREAGSDFADGHAYWEHPTFPGRPWDSRNWFIRNTSMVTALAKGDPGTLGRLALYRIAGKPYTVSEYCVPAPNDHQAETFPIIATYAALQDWDAVMGFDWGYYGAHETTDRLTGYFDMQVNPAHAGFLPAAALIFRAGELAPAPVARTLHIAPASITNGKDVRDEWSKANGSKQPDLFGARLQAVLGPPALKQSVLDATGAAVASRVKVTATPAGALYTARGEGAVAVVGYAGGQAVDLGSAAFTFPAFGNNYAALTLTALDRRPVNASRRLLLTLTGKAENTGMVWNAERTSVGANWGHAPVRAEGIPAEVTVANAGLRHVWALAPNGKRVAPVPATTAAGRLRFTVGPQYRTIWYELTP